MGSLVATMVAATPFLFYLYEYVPDEQEWNTIFGTYKSEGYGSANVAFWVLSMKIIPLLLSLIWFFTCKHWWYHVLIIPITMFSFQCIGAINDDIVFMDEFQIIYLLPIMAIVFPSIYLIRARMFNKINDHDKTMEELEEEFMIKPKTVWGKVKQYF
ncbi:MAG: hypothetical protein Wins2KO_03560 [Winogradskyella sp.]|uniref:hypothetical protein n=1 Tax=Winogradskyella sp. TaxID=1883156 RepID=UPI0025F13979|nr:hypothetical protein [Winogradskyella sp.]NRB58875.1 hypothetical protein [Winogradskyella sp.]